MKASVVRAMFALLPVATWAGNMSAGGGDAIICGKDFKTARVSLADTYSSMRGYHSSLLFRFSFERNDLRRLLLELAAIETPNLADSVKQKVTRELRFRFVRGPLPELGDDNIWGWPGYCPKRQLAIQDRSTGVVQVDKELFDRLTPLEQELLYIHEAYISLLPVGRNTRPIRAIVRRLFESPRYLKRLLQGSPKVNSVELSFATAMVQTLGWVPLSPEKKVQSIEDFAKSLYRYRWKEVRTWCQGWCLGGYEENPTLDLKNHYGREFLNLYQKHMDNSGTCETWKKDAKQVDQVDDVLANVRDEDTLFEVMLKLAAAHCRKPKPRKSFFGL